MSATRSVLSSFNIRRTWAAVLTALAFLACEDSPATIDHSGEPVATVIASLTADSLEVGSSVRVVAKPMCLHGLELPGAPVTWTTSAPDVAVVDASGRITGLSRGAFTLHASADDRTIALPLTVTLPGVWVGPDGATFTAAEGLLGVEVPAGALERSVKITAWPVEDELPGVLGTPGYMPGSVFELGPRGHEIARSVRVRVAFEAAGLPAGIDPPRLRLHRFDGSAWHVVPGSRVDLEAGIVHGSVDRFGHYGIVEFAPPVASLDLDRSSVSLAPGETLEVSATLSAADGELLQGSVEWTTSDPAVAWIDQNGTLVGLGVGKAVVTATSGELSASMTVDVLSPVVAVAIEPMTIALLPGGVIQLKARITGPGGVVLDRPIGWSSRSPAVARVSPAGLVTAVAPGRAEVVGTVEGKQGVSVVDVVEPVGSIELDPASAHLVPGEKLGITASMFARDGSPVQLPLVWKSSNATAASVDAMGVVTAHKTGVAMVTASNGSAMASARIEVHNPIDRVEVVPAVGSIMMGDVLALTATAYDALGNVIPRIFEWTTDHAGVAEVDDEGRVTGRMVGFVEIHATTFGHTGTAQIGVRAGIVSATIYPAFATIMTSEGLKLTCHMSDGSGHEVHEGVLWTSSDPMIAWVTQTGMVTGMSVGDATITATLDGVSATMELKVVPRPVKLTVSPPAMTLVLGGNGDLEAIVQDYLGTVLSYTTMDWATDDPEVVTVDGHGHVTAVGTGTARVTASMPGLQGVSTITVIEEAPERFVRIMPGRIELLAGRSVEVRAELVDREGHEIPTTFTWWSSDEACVTVQWREDRTRVLGREVGTVFVVATAETGEWASIPVTVYQRRPDPENGFGNNLSVPVVFAEGIGLTGRRVTTETGLRPYPAEGMDVGPLPFFAHGNTPDYLERYYGQQGPNAWTAEWADGSGSERHPVRLEWGSAVTSGEWDVRSEIRIVHVLHALGREPMRGFPMYHLYGWGEHEMMGTDGETGMFNPTVYSIFPRLVIQKLDERSREPVATLVDEAIHESFDRRDRSRFRAEVDMAGRLVYSYEVHLGRVELPREISPHGWWRIIFRFDDECHPDGRTAFNRVFVEELSVSEGPEPRFFPRLDRDRQISWLDVWIGGEDDRGDDRGDDRDERR